MNVTLTNVLKCLRVISLLGVRKSSLVPTCPLNKQGGFVCEEVGVAAYVQPLCSCSRSDHTADHTGCSLGVNNGENNDRQDQAVHGPEARDERPEETGDGVPAEPALCGKLHPEHYLRHRPSRATDGHSGGGRRWEVFHEGRDSAHCSDCSSQRGQLEKINDENCCHLPCVVS